MLFNIYVSDMPQNVDSILLQFADDVKMFRAIKTAQDYFCLQSDIDKLVAWHGVRHGVRHGVSSGSYLLM